MKHRRHVVAAAVGIVGFVVGLQWVVLVEHLLLVANVVAVLALLALMGLYTRYTSWWTSPVGLSTMALKEPGSSSASAGCCAALVSNLRSPGRYRAPPALPDRQPCRVRGWVLIAASTVWRLTVMWPYLHRDPNRTLIDQWRARAWAAYARGDSRPPRPVGVRRPTPGGPRD